MPSYSEAFLATQIGRAMRIHYDPVPGVRRKSTVQGGLFMGVENGRMKMSVNPPGRDAEIITIAIDADQQAFPERSGDSLTWWDWSGPQR